MSEEQIRYGDWAKEARGWIFGLSGLAWALIVGTGMPLLGAIGAHAWALAGLWLPIWMLLIIGIAVPVRGRPAATWLRDAAWRELGGIMGWTHWQSKAATGRGKAGDDADLPGVLAGIRTHDGPPFGPLMLRPAIVQDHAARTWTAVAKVTHPGIGLAEPGARTQMGAGLADLLEGAVTAQLVSVLAIQVRTVPDDGAERAAWQHKHLRADAPEVALRMNADLSSGLLNAGVRHEVFVSVVVPDRRIARQARASGGGVDGRARVLYSVMAEIENRLMGAVGATSVDWLDSPALATAIRTGFAPGERAGITTAALHADLHSSSPGTGSSGVSMSAAGPGSAPHPERRHYQHDAWSSVSCTVLMPERGAVMGALAPVLAPSTAGERRCLTVFFEPIAAGTADRLVGRESMSATTAAEVRTRMGFTSRAAHRRDAARVQGQDTRLAGGRALVRAALAVAVTVPSTWAVEDYGRRLEASVRAAGFEPLRLDLAQDAGFAAACIPLGVGLPQRRGIR
jgi:hypothetical protein